MKKQLLRVKQLADQAIARAEKTEVLTEDLVAAERRVDAIRQTCLSVRKKLSETLEGQGTEGSALEKRLKKLPESQLGSAMLENSALVEDHSIFSSVLSQAGEAETQLGHERLQHEVEVEQLVLGPLSQLLDTDIPTITKQRKALSKHTLDMDSARTRYHNVQRHSTAASFSAGASSTAGSVNKLDSIREELEDAQQKVEQCRDSLAGDMFQLIAREPELAQLVIRLVKLQREYHRSSLEVLERVIPSLEKDISNSAQKAVYGCALEDHLRSSGREIAYPLEVCVCRLMECGLTEEGLFRVAGSASKVKKLKTGFDAGVVDAEHMAEYRDPHVVAGALKSYLRELPEPLMSFSLYDDWVQAVKISDSDARLQALWQVLHRLPEELYRNLRYLIKFLRELNQHQDVNKMSAQNIAIVIAPNLMWAHTDETALMGMNMSVANTHSMIVDCLVTYADWFFPGEMNFWITYPRNSSDTSPNAAVTNGPSSPVLKNGTAQKHKRSSSGDHHLLDRGRNTDPSEGVLNDQSNGSLSDHNSPPRCDSPKPTMRRKKPAPVPPGMKSDQKVPGGLQHSQSSSPPAVVSNTMSLDRRVLRTRSERLPIGFENVESRVSGGGPSSIGAGEPEEGAPTPVPAPRLTHSRESSGGSGGAERPPSGGGGTNGGGLVEGSQHGRTERPDRPPPPAPRPVPIERHVFDKPKVAEKKLSSSVEVERSKPVVPARPPSLRREGEHGCLTIEVNQTDAATLEKAHVYSIDKQQVSMVCVGDEGEAPSSPSSPGFKTQVVIGPTGAPSPGPDRPPRPQLPAVPVKPTTKVADSEATDL